MLRKDYKLNFDKIKYHFQPIAQGACIGIITRWLTWGFEYSMYQSAEKDNIKSLFKIYKELFNVKSFYQLNKSFLKTGLIQTVGKSMANVGSFHYVDCNYPYLSATAKGFFVTCLCVPFETLFTSRGEYRKIQYFHQMPKNTLITIDQKFFPYNFKQIVLANFIRNFATSFITFGGIYKATEIFPPLFPFGNPDSTLIKGLSIALANIFIQPLNMPFINLQTYVLLNPNKPFSQLIRDFYREHTLKDLEKGVAARIVHRSIFYAITLMACNYLKNTREQQVKELNADDDNKISLRRR